MNFCIIYRIPKIKEKLNTYTRIIPEIPEIKRPKIPYTQNPWPGRNSVSFKQRCFLSNETTFHSPK